jgi:hypothetical protein
MRFAIAMNKTVAVLALALAGLAGGAMLTAKPAEAQATKEFGIDRSNLTRESEAVQEKTLQGIHALRATWFRDVLSAAAKPELQAKFVNEVRLAKQNNLKILVNVLPSYLDYDEPLANAGEDFRKMCGWSGGMGNLAKSTWPSLSGICARLWMR